VSPGAVDQVGIERRRNMTICRIMIQFPAA
jgi:hypothetical protein